METLIVSSPQMLILLFTISSPSPTIMAAKPGLKTNAQNALKDFTSTRKESVVKHPPSAQSSTSQKESVSSVIKAIM